MRFLRTNTAVIVTVGPFYDKTDGVTIETALTITNERITLTADTDAGSAPTNILDNIAGATSGTANDLNYITANDAGMMQLELAAADVNRLGRMFLSITDAANHVPVFHEFMVLPAMIYDAFVLGTDVLDSSVTQWLGTAVSTPTVAGVPNVNTKTWNDLTTVALPATPTNITAGTITTATNVTNVSTGGIAAASFAAGAIDAAAIAANAIGAAELASDVITDVWQGTALTEAYAADGVEPTPAQLLYMIWSAINEFAISGATLTCKKLDGSTTSMTFTLSDVTNPTSRTRAT